MTDEIAKESYLLNKNDFNDSLDTYLKYLNYNDSLGFINSLT